MKMKLFLSVLLYMSMTFSSFAFCGFYVAKGDSQLFNNSSRVIIARHDNKNVITMANDYQGEPKDFAMVIPVPSILKKSQINVTKSSHIDHIDSYSAPRLVEYFDGDPCQKAILRNRMAEASVENSGAPSPERAKSLGVTIEAQYTVGEYDILILSAKESTGLLDWLNENEYSLPEKAEPIIKTYLDKGMKFFVAKVNLQEHNKSAKTFLSPLQIAFESPNFMLPIQLGRINANGDQELFVYTITKYGKVKTSNYETKVFPTNQEIPLFIKDNFGDFYRDTFNRTHKKENKKVVFQEYAWDMNWCDPCAADPLSNEQLRELGAFWIKQPIQDQNNQGGQLRAPQSVDQRDAFITRLHMRYNEDTFPEDLIFVETEDRKNQQTRFILRHPWTGDAQCEDANTYFSKLPARNKKTGKTLAHLTGWDLHKIYKDMEASGQSIAKYTPKPKDPPKKWWEEIWQK